MEHAGIEDIFVVTGYNGEKVCQYLDMYAAGRNINIHHIANHQWEKANGISVLKAKDFIHTNFILSMSDHVYSASIIADLLNIKPTNTGVILAVDKRMDNPFIDIDDVTKVYHDNKKPSLISAKPLRIIMHMTQGFSLHNNSF
jgi:1L-myo-inositol 1-phosphate cytidylyltransferase